MTLMRLIGDHAHAQARFDAALHGANLREPGDASYAPQTPLRRFHERVKARLRGR